MCRGSAIDGFRLACVAFIGPTLLAFAGLWFGPLVLPSAHGMPRVPGFWSAFLNWDGHWYREIANQGYLYRPQALSSVAFFPVYPMAGRVVARATGYDVGGSLVIVAQVSAFAGAILMVTYLHRRSHLDAMDRTKRFAALAYALWPTTAFFHMAYSESLFVAVAIGAMYAMQRSAHPLVVALLIGLDTGCRPTGVALLGPFALYLWERARGERLLRSARNEYPAGEETVARQFLRSASLWLPLGCWGIGAFMLFQYVEFGDGFAFVKAHQYWAKMPPTDYFEQWGRALTLEPIWSVYVPSSPAYWAKHLDAPANPLFNLPFANPIYLLVSVYLVWLGWRKKWLDNKELLLAALLLGIPYIMHGYRHLMLSQGRFAAVVFPVYIVMGELMARMPAPLAAAVCALSAVLLAIYAAEFAASYRIT